MTITFTCPKCKTKDFSNPLCPFCCVGLKEVSGIKVIESRATREFLGYAQKTGMESYNSRLPTEASDYYPRYIPDGSKIILDVGGGDGNALAKYAQENPNSVVFVCDADITNLARLSKRKIDNLRPLCCQANLLPFGDGEIDAVFSLFMVEHMDDYNYSDFLFKSYELLKPGGVLVIASDSPLYDKYIHPIERFARQKVWRTTGFLEKHDVTKNRIHHHNLKTPIKAEQFISKHGFFIQDNKRHLIGSSHNFFRLLYEFMPKIVLDVMSTMYVIVAKKP